MHVDVSPVPNRLWQGEDSRKEQWILIRPFIHLSCSEQSRATQLRRAWAPTTPLGGSYHLVPVLLNISEALVDVFTLGSPHHRSYPVALQELSRQGWREGSRCSGLRQLLQTWQSVGPGCRDAAAVRAQLSKAFERCFCFTSNWSSQSLIRDGELSTVETPDNC